MTFRRDSRTRQLPTLSIVYTGNPILGPLITLGRAQLLGPGTTWNSRERRVPMATRVLWSAKTPGTDCLALLLGGERRPRPFQSS